ncbi:MAG: HAMP domain-containing histidine kinase [Bacteroidetes bacterium]|nr:HAMP domain-containing histidine kinase [Bacteroidota bacterium]
MEPVEYSGYVNDMLLERNSVGEQITKLVFKDKDYSWTVGMIEDYKDPFYSGTEISKDIEEKLKEIGIQAYCVFRLESEVNTMISETAVGTLSFFYRYPHRFSWRDIALARSLCKQSGNLIALYDEQKKLEKITEELSFTNNILKIESEMSARAEIVTLLAHDLGHKAMAVMSSYERFLNSVKKALKMSQSFNAIKEMADKTKEDISFVVKSLSNVNSLFMSEKGTGDEDQCFSLFEAIQEVVSTMQQALDRYNMSMDIQVSEKIKICGVRPVFVQILFNLLINSIDAQRDRRNTRKNTVHVHAEHGKVGEEMRIIIKYWDEGNGIDRSIFKDPKDIFELGATSKEKGTGRGLTISRNLLNTYFNGDIDLKDPKTAFFQIIIPIKR